MPQNRSFDQEVMDWIRKENNEKKVKNSKENSKLIKAFPKHIAALDKRNLQA